MAANNRIFYACQMVGFRPAFADGTPTVAKGVQSVGITTNFNLEQAFELGQIQIYENIEGLPDVEVTMEKVLDGYPLLFHLATSDAASVGLVGRSKARADVHLGIYSDEQDAVTDSPANPLVEVYCSGMYMGSVSYTIPVDGNATESVTLVGNNKEWRTGGTRKLTHAGTGFGTDAPKALTDASGGIQRRENVRLTQSIIPKGVYGVQQTTAVGNSLVGSTGVPLVHMQNVSISTDFSREDILELGRKTPYFRAPGFPIEVTCDLEAIAISGDFISAFEEGDPDLFGSSASGDNTTEEYIVISLMDGTAFDLGIKNRLSSVSYGGGDATGGNVSITYSYTNFNDLDVLNRQDPTLSALNYTPTQSGYLAPFA